MSILYQVAQFAIAVAMLGSAVASAQQLRVVVTDPTGAVVPDAEVRWSSVGGSDTGAIRTKQNGVAILPLIQGDYKVTIDAPGFTRVDKEIEITRGDEEMSLPIVLKVGVGGGVCTVCYVPPPDQPIFSSVLESLLEPYPALGKPIFASRVRRELRLMRATVTRPTL